MRTDEAKLQILEQAAETFNQARSGKLPYVRKAAVTARDTDKKLGTSFFVEIKQATGLDSNEVYSPSSAAAKGHIGKLVDAYKDALKQTKLMSDSIRASLLEQCAPPAEEPELPDWLRRAEERLQHRL